MPEGKNHCPKCESDDVLIGGGENPNRCAACKHKWKKDTAQSVEATSEHVMAFKSPEVLMTLNQDLRRKSKSFIQKLNEALKRI